MNENRAFKVKRLRDLEANPEILTTPVQYNRAARVLNGWLQNKTYFDEGGAPLVLPLEDDSSSFTVLVREYIWR